MPTFKITLAYDGSEFVGWQRQASGTSIQGLIEQAIRPLDDREVTVHGAGRTDAGVHACGQTASFTLQRSVDASVVARVLNAQLPPDVRVLAAEAVDDRFHARFSATGKTYRYRICQAPVLSPFERRYAWHVTDPLDVDAMDEAARDLEGRHDFAAFRSAGGPVGDTVRTIIRSSVRREDPAFVVYEVSGDGFLRHMVRAVVGTLVEIGRGRWERGRMRDVLVSRDRSAAGPTAPAAGLFLVAVEYGDL